MKKPKTVKSFLKLCLVLADVDRDELKGSLNISVEEYNKLGELRAGIQNELGEMDELLEKYNLKRRL